MKTLIPLLFLISFFLISCANRTDLRIEETDAIPAMEAVSVEPRTVTMVSDGTNTRYVAFASRSEEVDVFLDTEEEKLIVYFEEADYKNEETVVYSYLYEMTLDQEYEYLEVQVNDEPGELEIVLTDY